MSINAWTVVRGLLTCGHGDTEQYPGVSICQTCGSYRREDDTAWLLPVALRRMRDATTAHNMARVLSQLVMALRDLGYQDAAADISSATEDEGRVWIRGLPFLVRREAGPPAAFCVGMTLHEEPFRVVDVARSIDRALKGR